MKQIIQTNYSGIDGLKIVDKPKPAVSPLSALVQVKYTPVLPYDWMTEEGKLKQMRPGQTTIDCRLCVCGRGSGSGSVTRPTFGRTKCDRRATKRRQSNVS